MMFAEVALTLAPARGPAWIAAVFQTSAMSESAIQVTEYVKLLLLTKAEYVTTDSSAMVPRHAIAERVETARVTPVPDPMEMATV